MNEWKQIINVGEFFKISVGSLLANKVRSFLTMLGIIIGVGAVITMISLGQGAKRAVADRLQALGTNLIYIRSGDPRAHGPRMAIGSTDRLDEKDLKKLRANCVTVGPIVPEVTGNRQVIYGNLNWNTTIIGTSPEYFEMRNYQLAAGEPFTNSDVNALQRAAVVGPEVAKNLFGEQDPVGKAFRIGRMRFQVVGLTKEKGASGGWMDFDDVVIIPYTTAMKRVFGVTYINRLVAKAKDETMVGQAYLEIEKVLRESHRLRPDQDNDFFIQSQSDFAAAREETAQTLTYLLAGVALVSLLVGGIGIMNIMLVTVTERTREIGVRMAIGARRRDILTQFMLEAITLALLGGIAGIVFGIAGAEVIAKFFGWSMLVAPEAVVLSFIFAFVVGLFFGIYPARKASLLDPIEALRYE